MITLRVRARLGLVEGRQIRPTFVHVTRRGDLYDLGGELVEIFRIGTLAEAFDRDVRTLKDWERAGWLPRPLFQVEGSTHRRYSAAQLTNAHRLVWARWRQRRHVVEREMLPLFEVLRRIWFEPGVVIRNDGELDGASLVVRSP